MIDRIKLPSKAQIGSGSNQTQVTIKLNLPGRHVENNDSERRVQVLDVEFFDDLEIVLLAQIDLGFSKSSRPILAPPVHSISAFFEVLALDTRNANWSCVLFGCLINGAGAQHMMITVMYRELFDSPERHLAEVSSAH